MVPHCARKNMKSYWIWNLIEHIIAIVLSADSKIKRCMYLVIRNPIDCNNDCYTFTRQQDQAIYVSRNLESHWVRYSDTDCTFSRYTRWSVNICIKCNSECAFSRQQEQTAISTINRNKFSPTSSIDNGFSGIMIKQIAFLYSCHHVHFTCIKRTNFT